MTRLRLQRCANPKCWRHFVTAIDSPRVCCDLACELQRAAVLALRARAERVTHADGQAS